MTIEERITVLREAGSTDLQGFPALELYPEECTVLADLLDELKVLRLSTRSKKHSRRSETAPGIPTFRKWRAEYRLHFSMPDGRVFEGFFYLYADRKKDLPVTPKGILWTVRKPETKDALGVRNDRFVLDGQTVEEARENCQFLHGAMYPAACAENKDVRALDYWEYVERRIEDCIVPEQTKYTKCDG